MSMRVQRTGLLELSQKMNTCGILVRSNFLNKLKNFKNLVIFIFVIFYIFILFPEKGNQLLSYPLNLTSTKR